MSDDDMPIGEILAALIAASGFGAVVVVMPYLVWRFMVWLGA